LSQWRIIFSEDFSKETRMRLRRDGFAAVEIAEGVARLCTGPSEALYYSNAEIADGEFDDLPWEPPVALEARARMTGLHYGSMGIGFWNHSMILGVSNPVWFIYLKARGRYPLQGFFAQSGTYFSPIDSWGNLKLWKLVSTIAKPLAPINIVSTKPSIPGIDLTEWHTYKVEYLGDNARFTIDGKQVATLPAKPAKTRADAWIDNAVFLPGRDPGRVYRHVTQEIREKTCLLIDWIKIYKPE
jgi:hypothetical protein